MKAKAAAKKARIDKIADGTEGLGRKKLIAEIRAREGPKKNLEIVVAAARSHRQ
jgi:hypothetical protein